jgi:hypothetical protein
MAWTIVFDASTQVVELSFRGLVTGPELQEAATARIELGKDKGVCRYVIDATNMVAPKSTILDVLDIPVRMYAEKGMDRAAWIAVVAPRDVESRWIADFYENASYIRGWTVKVFAGRENASKWLQDCC